MNPTQWVQQVKDVPLEAVLLFRWNNPHLLVATEHFHLSLTPELAVIAHQYECSLLEMLLTHLSHCPSHSLLTMHRIEGDTRGRVCRVLCAQMGKLQQVLLDFQPKAITAGFAVAS